MQPDIYVHGFYFFICLFFATVVIIILCIFKLSRCTVILCVLFIHLFTDDGNCYLCARWRSPFRRNYRFTLILPCIQEAGNLHVDYMSFAISTLDTLPSLIRIEAMNDCQSDYLMSPIISNSSLPSNPYGLEWINGSATFPIQRDNQDNVSKLFTYFFYKILFENGGVNKKLTWSSHDHLSLFIPILYNIIPALKYLHIEAAHVRLKLKCLSFYRFMFQMILEIGGCYDDSSIWCMSNFTFSKSLFDRYTHHLFLSQIR